MNAARPFLALGLALLATMATSRAELPPRVYIDLQAKAPEVLEILVDEVTSQPADKTDHSTWNEKVQATVQKVTRSQSGLKKGDKITVVYIRLVPGSGWSGPSPAPQLVKGKSCPAYLEKAEDGTYALAARGKSFEPIKP